VPAELPTEEWIENWLRELYIAADGTDLRREDRKKAAELAALLPEIARALPRGRGETPTLVDAASGKAYVGLLAGKTILEAAGRAGRVVAIERDSLRHDASASAAAHLPMRGVDVHCVKGAVEDPAVWPEAPALVVALHACGAAADAILSRTIAVRARRLLLVPCCTGADEDAEALADHVGMPRHAGVRRRFVEAVIDGGRTLRLEAAGYETEVVAFVSPKVTPYNLLWRARFVGEPGRMREAAERLARLRGGDPPEQT
jgi:hypothetical protein